VIVVASPEWLRIKRVSKRDHSNESAIRSRMKNQWPEEEKIKRARFIIHNDEEQLIIPQVLSIHRELLNQ
ncbi:MAG: dephospho-CoA kinase, partial [Chitinophagales bacterium]